ncbi:hypothetical protein C2S53_013572 [Perilla frutescens var. hirtella]|uniref:RRM domain-containing protein n=1 Tax=Perilla frutescens var. hirtella TaxID=608512 RepID=A0AAD4IYQ9_PERFH|nr:hypothetical protein C2S53_013572 [Perilla frutescens var. hirtella]
MKARLAASIYLFSAGKCWINTRSAVSSRSIFPSFNRRYAQIDCSFHARGFEISNRAIHASALEEDAFSELGPGESECSFKKIRLVTAKCDDFVDADAFSESDLDMPKCSAKEIKSVTKKPDVFLADAFSELGPGISDCSAKQLKLVTEKRDHFPKTTHSHRKELASRPVSSDYKPDVKELLEYITKASTTMSTKSRALIHMPTSTDHDELASRPLSSDDTTKASKTSSAKLCASLLSDKKTNSKELSRATTKKASTTSSTKLCAPLSSDNKPNSKELSGATTNDSTASSTKLRAPLSSDDRPNSKKLSGATTKASTTSSTKLHAPVHVPTSIDDTREISEIEYPLSISIKNIPSEIDLPELIKAISEFGKVSGASFVTTSNKLKCCHIEFEDAVSSRGAILAGKVEVGSHVFLVNALEDLVTVRIKNINKDTTDSAIHSICKSAGELVGLARTGNDGVDAFFNVRNYTSHLDIVKRLNNTVLDLSHWSACVLTSISNSSEVPSEKDARYKLHSQIFYHFSKLKTELHLKQVYLSDLEYLNACIRHMQDVSD